MRHLFRYLAVSALLIGLAAPAFATAPPPFTVSFSATQFTIPENLPLITFQRGGNFPNTATVQVSIKEMPGGVTTTRQISVYSEFNGWYGLVQNDNFYNPGRSFVITMLSVDGGGAIVAPSTTTVTVVDDEPVPAISITDLLIDEGSPVKGVPTTKQAVFTITLTSALSTTTTIPAIVHPGSAKNGSDYQLSAASLVFAPGQVTSILPVPIIGDAEPEGDETFTVELFPSAPIIPTKTIGTCTIRDDDDAVSPTEQTIAKSAKGSIKIRLGDPGLMTEQVLLQQTDPTLCTVPSLVTIPAGASGVDLDFVCNHAGTGSIVATLPPSRGGRSFGLSVTVIEKTALFLDTLFVNLPYGGSSNVNVTIEPLSPVPITLLLQPSIGGIVDVPTIVTIGTDGKGVIPVHAIGVGSTIVNLSLPEINGGTLSEFAVVVAAPSGLTITKSTPARGAGTGGDTVTLSGNEFTGRCAVTFGGVPARKVISQSAGAITVTTPPHEWGVVDLGIRCGTKSYILPKGFTYDQTHPLVNTVGPLTGTRLGGTFVILRGVNFNSDSCTVRFGDVPVPVASTDGTSSLQVVSPPHAVGTVNVSLVCGTEVVTMANAFQYVTYDDTQARGTTFITTFAQGSFVTEFEGGPYRRDDQLFLNGVAAEGFSTPSISTHRFWMPEYTGKVEMKLRDYAGRTIVRTVDLIAPAKPTIDQIPSAITLGSEFTITGNAFRRSLTYALGPALLQPVSITNTSAVFRAPISLGTGTKTFAISDQGVPVVTANVDIQSSGPSISAVSPPCAAPEGGTLVTLSGSGFNEGAMVQFGTTFPAELTVKNPFTIQAKLPQWYGNAQPQITVFNPDGSSATLTNALTYKSAADGGCGAAPGGGRHRAAGH